MIPRATGSRVRSSTTWRKKVRRPPLPPASAGTPQAVEVTRGARKSDLPALPPEVVEAMAREATPERKITVPKDLSHPHAIVRARLEEWRRPQQTPVGSPPEAIPPRLRMTEPERRRLRILSALCKALDARGHKVEVDPKDHHNLTMVIGGEKVEVRLTHRQKQTTRPLTAEEKADWYNVATGRQFTTERQDTDDLVFRIRSDWWLDRRAQKEWADKPDRLLENRLNDIVAGLIAAAAVQREHRIKHEEMRRHQQEQIERWKRQEEAEAEARRFEVLVRQVEQWRQANEIRAYVKAVKMRARATRRAVDPDRLQEWTVWALRHADRIDLTVSEK